MKKHKRTSNYLLGKHPGRTLHRIGVSILGIWLAGTSLKFIWPEHDQISIYSDPQHISLEQVKKLNILLLISKDINNDENYFRQQTQNERIISNVHLITLRKGKELKLTEIPSQFVTNNSRKNNILSISELYNIGGEALLADISNRLQKRQNNYPEKFILTSESNIMNFLNEFEKNNFSSKENRSKANLILKEQLKSETNKYPDNINHEEVSSKLFKASRKLIQNSITNISLNEFSSITSLVSLSKRNDPLITKIKNPPNSLIIDLEEIRQTMIDN